MASLNYANAKLFANLGLLPPTESDLLWHLNTSELKNGFREGETNVVETSSGERNFVEDAWIGQVLAIGDSVRLSVTGPCPRCVMTTLPQGDLPKDTGILRSSPAQ